MADTVGQKTIQPVKATGEVAPAAKRQPTQQQIQTATLLRSLGVRPNNPKQKAVDAAAASQKVPEQPKAEVAKYAPSKSADYQNLISQWAGDMVGQANDQRPGTEAYSARPPAWSDDFVAAHPFDPNGDLYWDTNNPKSGEAFGGMPDAFNGIRDKTRTDNGFGMLIDFGVAAVTGGLGGITPGIGGTLGLTGAPAALANTAGQQLLTTGKLNPKGLVAAGIASPITSTLTGVGINPAIARAATSLATGAITGRDPRSSLLSALIGGINTGNPAATALVKALLTSMTPVKKKGK